MLLRHHARSHQNYHDLSEQFNDRRVHDFVLFLSDVIDGILVAPLEWRAASYLGMLGTRDTAGR